MSLIRAFQSALVVASSLLVALLLSEVSLRLFFPQNLSGTWRVIHPSGLMLNRSDGTARHQLGDIAVTYSFGEFHNRKLGASPRRGATKKVLVLGDSFTFGWLLADGFTYVDRLQKVLPDRVFLNAAAGGWGTADYAKYLELFCSAITPSEVYIFLNTDDIGRAWRSSLYKLGTDGSLVTGEGSQRNAVKTTLNRFPIYNWLLQHSHLVSLARRVYLVDLRAEDKTGTSNRAQIEAPSTVLRTHEELDNAVLLGEALFSKIKKDTDSCGSELTVFYTGWVRLDEEADASNPTIAFLREAREASYFQTKGIKFYDLANSTHLADVHHNPAAYRIPLDGHPNELGAERIFLAASERLVDH